MDVQAQVEGSCEVKCVSLRLGRPGCFIFYFIRKQYFSCIPTFLLEKREREKHFVCKHNAEPKLLCLKYLISPERALWDAYFPVTEEMLDCR